MALWDKLKAELIDIVQWLDDTNDTLIYRFPRYNNEIKTAPSWLFAKVRQRSSLMKVRLLMSSNRAPMT